MTGQRSVVLLAGALVAVGLLVWGLRTAQHDRSKSSTSGRGPVAVSNGHPASESANPLVLPNAGTELARRVESPEELRQLAPAGQSDQYAINHFETSVSPPLLIEGIVREVSGLDLFPEAPFRVAWMFGECDRPWFEHVRENYRLELKDTIAQQGDQQDESMRSRIERQLQAQYQSLLRNVATQRVAASPEIQRRFFDGRRMADLSQDSEQYQWLYQVFRQLGPHAVFAVGLNKPEDMVNFAATDLPELVRLDLDIQEAFRPVRDRTVDNDEAERIVRPLAERFQALVSSRKP